ncbi:hypothetical protein GA398_08175 [Bacteroides xylanisolvens]|uniref:Uncharacterized protein n=1 Tax=Bacteroides xylanisolvens TaxID=371601 RepID=A0A7J5PYH3_9BACE|nr:hypothetical protein [Bacteroides xylanisolvens]KAB6148223.1 hypothetical protein GA398_08175 [Bacteroides xylanisolvens]
MEKGELEDIFKKRSHLVILGAGATIAALPNGDRFGKKSSVMNDFLSNLGLSSILDGVELKTTSTNIEDIYSELYERSDEKAIQVREELEKQVYNYFSSLRIPEEPTIYDLLLLSLTEKDCIVSFNWDDILIQAFQRAKKITSNLPRLAFLHGNVGAGYCKECGEYGARRNRCHSCGSYFIPAPLLYPVREKDYHTHKFIFNQWEVLRYFIASAAVVTVFGYSAPKTDTAAIEIFKDNFLKFGENVRQLDRIEIIEAPNKTHEEIYESWGDFIGMTHGHINIHHSFFDSLLAEFPRRTMEGYTHRYISGYWGSSAIKFESSDNSFTDIGKKIAPLLEDEEKDILEIYPDNYSKNSIDNGY